MVQDGKSCSLPMFSGAPTALTLDGAPEPNNPNWGIPGLVMTNVAIEHGHLVH